MTDPSGSPERAAAIRLIRTLAAARRFRIAARVQRDLEELGLDAEDVAECLCALATDQIQKDEADETIKDKHVYVFDTEYEERRLYVKLSIRVVKDHDLSVVSFKLRSTW